MLLDPNMLARSDFDRICVSSTTKKLSRALFSCFGVGIQWRIFYCNSVLAMMLIGLSNFGSANGAAAFYAFGDSFADTGNGGYFGPPFGMTWPGYPAGRACDGRNKVDYLAELFGVPSPTPYAKLKNDSESTSGVNFARAGGGVTYAFGYTPLDTQVDMLEALVQSGVLTKFHLGKSVALVSLGLNDYSAHSSSFKESPYAQELNTTVTTEVDGITVAVGRLHDLGIRNIVIANLASMACSPYITVESNYTACSSSSTLQNETLYHNSLLEQRVRLLNRELQEAHFIIVDQTKAFEHIFLHGADYGFEDPLTPCCTGKNDSHVLDHCGDFDSEGQPLYKVCENVEKAVIFDGVHPTQAAWKVVIHLYATVPGFTREGPELLKWIQQYNV